jgi:spermidine synthase
VFALLETGVAVYALCLPWLIHKVDVLISNPGTQTGLGLWYSYEMVAALVLLLIPAMAMGAGFPLILKAVESTSDSIQVSLAKIYGLNTLGGALGALLPLWLLPAMGWLNAIRIVAGLGIVIGVTAFVLSRMHTAHATSQHQPHDGPRPALRIMLSYAALGAAALMLEVGWTRLFGMILLRTEYVLAIILAVFLVGVGVGSLLVRRQAHSRWFGILPVVTALFGLMSLWGIPVVSRWMGQLQFDSLFTALVWQGLAIVALTLPVTLSLGAWLPLLASRFGRDSVAGPWLYGANSLGAAAGALLMGFILIPAVGTVAAVVVASLALYISGMMWCETRRVWWVAPVLLVLAWPVMKWPSVQSLLPDIQAGSKDLYRYEDAVSITHVVERPDGQRLLLSDLQRMDASSDPTSVALQKNQARLPLMLHRRPHKVLFLGLGTGISASGVLGYPDIEITAVELSRGAIYAASHAFAAVNDGVMNNIRVIRDDARRYLMASTERFDVIIGDVFHPDLVGRSNLLSVQQFRRARDHLASGGLFVQWLALNQFDPGSLAVVMRSFENVFPAAVVFMDGFRLALVGPNGDFPGAQAVTVNLARLNVQQRRRVTGSEGEWTWLGRYFGQVNAGPGVVQDEWAPRIEYDLPRARYKGEFDLDRTLAWLLKRRPQMSGAVAALHIGEHDERAFERAYVATDLAVRSWLADLHNDDGRAQQLIRLAYEANSQDHWVASSLADKMLLTLPQALNRGIDKGHALMAILRICPDHIDTLRALWHLEQDAGNDTQADKYLTQLKALIPLDREIRGLQSR